jgi:peptide deformylase
MAEEAGQIQLEDEGAERDPEAEARRRFALAQIRQYPDPALRLEAREVAEVDEDVERLAERMIQLMHDARGVGLAATQVGVLRRMFVFQTHDDEEARVVVNPRLVDLSKDRETDDEGCLSLQGVLVPVERAVRVRLEGLGLDGEEVAYELEGLGARVAQHEFDHLEGVLIIDRTDRESRRQAMAVLRPQPLLVGP